MLIAMRFVDGERDSSRVRALPVQPPGGESVGIYATFMPERSSLATLRRGVAYRRRLRFVESIGSKTLIPTAVFDGEKSMDALYIALLVVCVALTVVLVPAFERLRHRP